jgi:hypothetical protein
MQPSKMSKAKSKYGSTPDSIAIAYAPSSVLPAERLSSSETAAQPLSLRTRALIDLQTYEGYFTLDLRLASFLGISIMDLEANLARFIPSSNIGMNEELKRRVWATILAIELFETQLAGERSVWGLVADKARAWTKEKIGAADTRELEKLVREVLGV